MEFLSCWPTTPGPGACPGMWLICPGMLHCRKFPFPSRYSWQTVPWLGRNFVCPPPPCLLCQSEAVWVLCVHMCTRAVVSEGAVSLYSSPTCGSYCFSASLQHRSLSLERTGFMKTSPLGLTDPESHPLHAVQLWVSVLIIIYRNKRLLRSRAALWSERVLANCLSFCIAKKD